MADEKGGGAEEGSPSTKCVKYFQLVTTSMAGILIYLRLISDNISSHPMMQKLELGKLAFTLATTATLGLVLSPTFPAHYFVAVGFIVGCAVIWNGILFEIISLQLMGITLILCLLCVLVDFFLPISFSWASSWLSGALFLMPLIYLLIKSQPAAGGDDA